MVDSDSLITHYDFPTKYSNFLEIKGDGQVQVMQNRNGIYKLDHLSEYLRWRRILGENLTEIEVASKAENERKEAERLKALMLEEEKEKEVLRSKIAAHSNWFKSHMFHIKTAKMRQEQVESLINFKKLSEQERKASLKACFDMLKVPTKLSNGKSIRHSPDFYRYLMLDLINCGVNVVKPSFGEKRLVADMLHGSVNLDLISLLNLPANCFSECIKRIIKGESLESSFLLDLGNSITECFGGELQLGCSVGIELNCMGQLREVLCNAGFSKIQDDSNRMSTEKASELFGDIAELVLPRKYREVGRKSIKQILYGIL
jgi:hypothetical protein